MRSMPAASSSVRVRTIRPGEPTTSEPFRDHLSFRDERARSDEASAADDGTVEHHRVDSDERAVLHRASVQHRMVAHADVRAEGEGKALVDVQNRRVLDIGAVADGDAVVVAAHDAVEPDARLVAEHDGADDGRVVGDVVVPAHLHAALAKGVDHGFEIPVVRR